MIDSYSLTRHHLAKEWQNLIMRMIFYQSLPMIDSNKTVNFKAGCKHYQTDTILLSILFHQINCPFVFGIYRGSYIFDFIKQAREKR